MKLVAAILLTISFLLALVFGAQTAEWSWGPALVGLGLACAAAVFIKGGGGGLGVGLALLPAAGWILYRGATSEVADFTRADVLLLLAVLGTATVVFALRPGVRSVPILFAGLAVVSLLNLSMGVIQSQSPEFMWPYHHRPSDRVTGFFGHYNYFSSFTYTVGLLLAARGFFAKDHVALRFLFVTTAFWSAVMVPVSGSRGGTVAMAVGVVVLVACAGVLAWRQGAWWSKVFLILFPLLLVGSVAAGWMLLSKVQADRDGQTDVAKLADNSGRLEWAELAMEVGADHMIIGGGSRAYSWERNQHWDVGNFGRGGENERFVHNELLQLFTDYGLVGVVLVLIPIGWVGWLGLSRIFLGESGGTGHLDAVAAGVLAGGAAMLTQANFSFIFHFLPLAMSLGLLLGLGSLLVGSKEAGRVSRTIRVAVGGVVAVFIAWFGIPATQTLNLVWPVMYAETSLIYTDPEAAVDRLERAADAWPGHRMLEEAGNFSRVAAAGAPLPSARRAWNERAVVNYREAKPLHPHHPGLPLNEANALAELNRHEEAESAYLEAIRLQGGLESAFQARYFYAKAVYELWYAQWNDPGRREAGRALWGFKKALAILDAAKVDALWELKPQKELRAQLEKAIAFLEGAKVRPVAPGEPSE